MPKMSSTYHCQCILGRRSVSDGALFTSVQFVQSSLMFNKRNKMQINVFIWIWGSLFIDMKAVKRILSSLTVWPSAALLWCDC